MNHAFVDQIARAVLYEGYMLYPYRPSSVKNRERWNFGVLYPRAYSELQTGSDACMMQTECLVEGSLLAALEVKVRFLQMVQRSVGQLPAPVSRLPANAIPEFRAIEKLEVDGRLCQSWQEAVEQEVALPPCSLQALSQVFTRPCTFHAKTECEAIRDLAGAIPAIIVRERQDISADISVTAVQVGDELFRVCVRICNTTPLVSSSSTRDQALLCSLVSTHTVLGIQDGRFVSAVDPPEHMRGLAADCKNIGAWPVLVGEDAERGTMLSSPIILYDYPQIAPESSGDLFDGTEIDEILSLRIMTLTDEEKREMRQSDDRARQLLERTETLPVEHLMKMHGALRGLRAVKEDAS